MKGIADYRDLQVQVIKERGIETDIPIYGCELGDEAVEGAGAKGQGSAEVDE